jgi:hypothetical protein
MAGRHDALSFLNPDKIKSFHFECVKDLILQLISEIPTTDVSPGQFPAAPDLQLTDRIGFGKDPR